MFEGNPREVKEIDGELVEIDPSTLRKKQRMEQGRTGQLPDRYHKGHSRLQGRRDR